MHHCVCWPLSLIETSLCAQALWVDVSSGLGRRPPSSYPSGEQSPAKPNLASQPPINPQMAQAKGPERETQTQTQREWEREREAVKIKNTTLVWHNRVVCLSLCILLLPQDSKMGFSPFRGSFVLMYMHQKAPLFPCQYFISGSPIYHTPGLAYPCWFFFLCPPSSVDINTQDVTAGYAPNAPSVLISPKCESVILL